MNVHLFHLANPHWLRGHELEANPVAVRDAARTVNHLMRAVVEAFDSDGRVQGIADGDARSRRNAGSVRPRVSDSFRRQETEDC